MWNVLQLLIPGEAPTRPLSAALCQDGAWHSALASRQLQSIEGKSENTDGDWGTVLLCARVAVLPKSRASGERPVPAVVPGPVTEPGWQPASPTGQVPGELLQTARQEVGLCQTEGGVGEGSSGPGLG